MSATFPKEARLIKSDTKIVVSSTECATIPLDELKRRWMEYRRAYLALESYFRSIGLDLK